MKVNIVEAGSKQVMDKFKPADLKELPQDLVKFINRLPKGNKLNPLEKDTLQISTYKTGKNNREVELTLPIDEGSGFYARLTDNEKDMKAYPQIFNPISVEGFKNAVRSIANVRKNSNI